MFLSLKPACGYAEQAREQTNTLRKRERERKQRRKQTKRTSARSANENLARKKLCVGKTINGKCIAAF